MSFLKPVSKKGHGRKNRLADVLSENYSNFWSSMDWGFVSLKSNFFLFNQDNIDLHLGDINWPNKYIWQTFKCFKSARDAT